MNFQNKQKAAQIMISVLIIFFSTTLQAHSGNPKDSVMLHLSNSSFDPMQTSQQSPSVLSVPAEFTQNTRYFIIQFDHPIQMEDHQMMSQLGIKAYDYIPNFAFIVRMSASAQKIVKNKPHVRWVGPYSPNFKLAPDILEQVATRIYDKSTNQEIDIRVIIFPDEDLPAMLHAIRKIGDIKKTFRTRWQTSVKVKISVQNIPLLSHIQGIKWISLMPKWQLLNNVASNIVKVAQARNRFALHGEGQVVGVCDTGLDQGNKKPSHLHDDFEDGNGKSRVKDLFNLTQGFFNDYPDDIFSGHGTHVAGTIMGNGYHSGSHPKMSYFPDTAYVGIAPKAQLVFQAAEDSNTGMLLGLTLDLNRIFEQAYLSEARIHSNSWGAATGSTYSAECADVDQFMWDNSDFLIVFAAGNSGVDMDHDGRIDPLSICSPASAKNCLTVGGSESVRPEQGYSCAWGECWPKLYTKDPVASDHLADNPDGMAAFSSRGPTIDGRFKPDIVAPATNIVSVRSSRASHNGWGVSDNTHYMLMGGTSMATPIVSGTAVLMREYLVKIGINNPPASLIKAAILNSAVSMSPGQYGNEEFQEIHDKNPNNTNGWGRLNLENAVYPKSPISIIYKYTDQLTTGETIAYYFQNMDSQYPIKINLVWTDFPGSPIAQGGLVNDLDFHVVGPNDHIYYPDNAMHHSIVKTLQYDLQFPVFQTENHICGMRFTLEKTPAFLDAVSISIANPEAIQDDVWVRVYDISDETHQPEKLRYEKKYRYLPSGWTTLPINHVEFQSNEFLVALEKSNPDIRVSADIFTDSDRGMTRQDSQWKSTGENYYIRAHVRSQDHSTDYDRVNNCTSIYLKEPKRGAYHVKVTGYNIPKGPQPFALVAHGAIREAPPQKSFSIHMPETFKEGDGTLAEAGMVSIPEPLEIDLMVFLTSSDFTEIIVPQHIVIPAGQMHARFDIQVVDDPAEDGMQTVIVEARAQSYFPASISVTVDDNDARPVLVVSPDNIIVPHIEGTAEFMITNAGTGRMEWYAAVDSDWLTILSGKNGVDSGMVKLSYSKNNISARIGHLMVHVKDYPTAMKKVSIHQKSEKIETILSPDDGYRYDYFGYANSIWKNQAVIGAYKHDNDDTDNGAAYVFTYEDLSWKMTQKLCASDSSRQDYFGFSVSIHDKQIAVGAYNVDDSGNAAGAAYIFEHSDNQWLETAKLLASDGERNDYFGHSVSICNNHMVAGAYKADGVGRDSGAAYVFEKNNNKWTETCRLIPSKLKQYDYYGYATAISGNYIIIGAYGDDTRGTGAGAAYIFEKSNGKWKEKEKLIPDAAKSNDYSGYSVDISEKYAVIGAYKADIKGPNAGAVYVFERKNGRWVEIKSLYPWAAKDYDYLGASVAIKGNYIIAGAYGDSKNGRLSGAAYVFRLVDGIWENHVYLNASDGQANDRFGTSVCISERGDGLVGAYGHDAKGSKSGASYLYSVLAMTPKSKGPTIIPNAFVSDTEQFRNKKRKTNRFDNQPSETQWVHFKQKTWPAETEHSGSPVIVYQQVPELGNRIKNLKGTIRGLSDVEDMCLTVYIFQEKRWELKAAIIPISPDYSFEVDITTKAGDHLANKIAVILHTEQHKVWPLSVTFIPDEWIHQMLYYNIIQR